ncbi:MAG: methyl-accepting chemotaxis protein [Terracidiphilus sp.]|jgi:methyl-accepting chemotaxis protein
MNWFNDMKIGKKLIGAFILVGAITAVVGYMGISNMGKIADLAASLYANETLGISYLKQADIELIHMDRAEKNLLLSSTTENRDYYKGRIQADIAFVNGYLEKARPLVHTDKGKELLAKFDQSWKEYQDVAGQVVSLAEKDQLEQKRASLDLSVSLGRQKGDAAETALADIVADKESTAEKAAQTTGETYHSSRTFMLVLVAGGILCGLGLGFFIARSISRPLAKLAETAKHISLGDVSQNVDYRSGDEVGSLADSFRALVDYIREVSELLERIAGGDLTVAARERSAKDKLMQSLASMVQRLNSTLRDVADNAANASSSSQQLAAASEAIASGAQEQAASLEETSASLEEITATVRQSADNAQQASQLAVSSKDAAVRGQEVVTQAITAMSEINAASAKISDIISTIDEIAFQTNLLAVNAAVEAARAGDEGRGFAVVASEVRSLAQRSALAAKEIKVLIQDSLRKVDAGSALVNRSGETLQGIVGSVKRVTDIVGEMAAAASEQSAGIEQVNTAMTQMDHVTQSNSAQTEELSATAQALSEQAANLLHLLTTFTLDNGGKNQGNGRGDSRRAEAYSPNIDPAPRHPNKAVRSSAPARADNSARVRKAPTRPVAPVLAVAPSTGSDDASFGEF